MQVDVSSPNSYTRELKIQLQWEEMENDFAKSTRKFGKRLRLPGFRPGKIPRKVLLNKFQPEIEAHFVEEQINHYYLAALNQEDIIPVNKAEVENIDFKFESHLSFKAKAEVEPDIKLPRLRKRSIKVQRNIFITDEEDLNAAIEELRRSKMEIRTVEDGAQAGDFIIADFQKLDSTGVPIIGEKLEQRFLKIGEDPFTGENEKKMIGAKAEAKIRIDIPVDQSGSIAPYELSVINVERQVLPELNQEFAKSVDPECGDMESFKSRVRENITQNYEKRSNENLDRQLSDALIAKVEPDYPPSMVGSYLDHLIEELKGKNGQELNEEKVRQTYRPIAERNLKWYLVRKAVISDRGLEISKEDVDQKIQEIMGNNPDHKKELQKYYKKPSNRQRIEDDLMEKKILDYIREFAKIKDVKVTTKELREQSSEVSTVNE